MFLNNRLCNAFPFGNGQFLDLKGGSLHPELRLSLPSTSEGIPDANQEARRGPVFPIRLPHKG